MLTHDLAWNAAVAIMQSPGPRHPTTVTATRNLGMALFQQRKWVEAERVLWQTYKTYRHAGGAGGLQTAEAGSLMLTLARCLEEQGHHSGAHLLYQKARHFDGAPRAPLRMIQEGRI